MARTLQIRTETENSHMTRTKALMVAAALWAVAPALPHKPAHAAESPYAPITTMRDLHLETILVRKGAPNAVIVVPPDGRYAEAVARIQAAIHRAGGTAVPVRPDTATVPKELLKTRNVIAIGNMATSTFIRRLYHQYYTYLDLWYPGKGGYVVRSLHNPFGTGRNVVFLGGSEDVGVGAAAQAFVKHLKKRNGTASVDWLMDIRLGDGMNPPKIEDTVRSWKDTSRQDEKGRWLGYPPAGRFCWHPISHCAALYYMTGEKEYLDEFLNRALTRSDDGTSVNANPIVTARGNHYKYPFIPLLCDLIEESPQLTDAERLAIINGLGRAEEKALDVYCRWTKRVGGDSVSPGDRHYDYEALCGYTGSRYFAKYYAQLEWPRKYLADIKKYFSVWANEPYWGGSAPSGVSPGVTECVFDYYLLSGSDALATSGGAEKMLQAFRVLWDGTRNSSSASLNLLRKGAWYLDDPKYTWFGSLPTYDLGIFRIGQSYALSDGLKDTETPAWLRHTIQRLPLPRWQRPENVAENEGYLMISYRTTLDEGGDFFLLDGYGGKVRTEQHVQALKIVRIAGLEVLAGRRWGGYGSQLIIRQDGLSPAGHVPNAAAARKTVAFDTMAYVHSRTEGFGTASWDRHILHLAGERMLVLDRIETAEPGTFDIRAEWHVLGAVPRPKDAPVGFSRTDKGAVVCCATPVAIRAAPWEPGSGWSTIAQLHKADIAPSKPFVILNLLYPKGHPGATLRKVGERSAVVVFPEGEAHFVGLGSFSGRGLNVRAELAYLSPSRIVLIGGTGLEVAGRQLVHINKPVDLSWRPSEGSMQISVVGEPADIRLAIGKSLRLTGGLHELTPDALPDAGLAETLRALTPAPLPATVVPEDMLTDWKPVWQVALDEEVTDVAVSGPHNPQIWVGGVKGKLAVVGNGEILKELTLKTPIRDVEFMSGPNGRMVLAACGDWNVYAYSPRGKPLWTHTCEPLARGDWRCSGFNPEKADQKGVFALVPLPGAERHVAGVSVFTVEVLNSEGHSLSRSAYLDHWRGPQGVVPNTAVAAFPPDLVESKGRKGLLAGASIWCLTADHLQEITWKPGGAIEIDNRAYDARAPGQPSMGAMKTRRVRDLLIADLNGDGRSEVIYSISGRWNELRVYDRAGKPLWYKAFGPARTKALFLRSVDCADCDGDGKLEVAAGCEDGWVYLFKHDGTLAWSRRLAFPVSRVLALPGIGLVAGTTTGVLFHLSPDGEILRTAKLDSEITVLRLSRQRGKATASVVAGTDAGVVSCYGIP